MGQCLSRRGLRDRHLELDDPYQLGRETRTPPKRHLELDDPYQLGRETRTPPKRHLELDDPYQLGRETRTPPKIYSPELPSSSKALSHVWRSKRHQELDDPYPLVPVALRLQTIYSPELLSSSKDLSDVSGSKSPSVRPRSTVRHPNSADTISSRLHQYPSSPYRVPAKYHSSSKSDIRRPQSAVRPPPIPATSWPQLHIPVDLTESLPRDTTTVRRPPSAIRSPPSTFGRLLSPARTRLQWHFMFTESLPRDTTTEPTAEAVQDVESSSVVTGNGGVVSVKGVKLICPPGAVEDPVAIKLILEEAYKYCGLIVNHGLENDLKFGAPIINCQPNGQMFKKHVNFVIAVDSEKENSIEAFLVLHGTPREGGKIYWEDVTRDSKFDLKNKELSVNIDRFSIIAVLVRLAWVQTKEIATRLNLISFKYMLSVLFKSSRPNVRYDELAFVFMSRDIYGEQFYREHDDCALMKLKSDGFEELCSNVKRESGFIYNNENLKVFVQLGEDYKPAKNQQERITLVVDSSVWWSTGHVVKLSLQASGADAKILCGKIVVEGQHGHVEEDHFCQQDLCGYVKRLLGVENAIFNIKPLTLKLGLSKETLNEAVTCDQSEANQLEMILLRWREAHKNTDDFAVLRKALEGLQPEDYRVKERGQMHIEHLRELTVTIVGLQNKDTNMMKYLGQEIKTLCNSILRDCCIEMATSKEELDLATSTENCAGLLESYRQIRQIPGDIAKKCQRLFMTREESTITADFLVIVPQLVQTIKEIFRDENVPHEQSGLRGVGDETTLQKMVSNIQEAAKGEKISRLFCEVSYILEHLCLNNNGNRSTENEIHQWGSSNMIITMLQFLEKFFQSSEEQRLYKRLHVFSFNIRDIMSNPEGFERNFLRDFHNVVLSLLKFAKFNPSQLVRFELSDPINSCHTQGNDGLKYDKSEEIFSQLFWISKESDDELQLEAIAHVHIHGRIQSIGAFESLITLPVSCSKAIDRFPIGSLSVAVRREHDDSGNLRITLFGTQKEKIIKALKYLENELGTDVVDLSQTSITPSHLKMRSSAKAGTLVSLRLVHKWESGKLVLDSNDFVTLADSAAGGASVPDSEIAAAFDQLALRSELPALPVASDPTVGNCSNFVMDPPNAELFQKHLHEQRGPIEIHYHQTFQRGHVCVAGEHTSLNMQPPNTEQRSLETGPSAASHKCLTAGTDAHEG